MSTLQELKEEEIKKHERKMAEFDKLELPSIIDDIRLFDGNTLYMEDCHSLKEIQIKMRRFHANYSVKSYYFAGYWNDSERLCICYEIPSLGICVNHYLKGDIHGAIKKLSCGNCKIVEEQIKEERNEKRIICQKEVK